MPHTADLRVEHALFVRSFFSVSPPTRVVSQVAARLVDHELRRGEIVFERGAQAHAVYFLVRGRVRLEHPEHEPWHFERGATIGIADAVLDRPHARTARADTDAHLVSIEYEDYNEILEDNFGFAKTMLETTMRAIHAAASELGVDEVFAQEDLRGADPIPVRWGSEIDSMRKLLCLRDVHALSTAPVQPLVTLSQVAGVRHWAPGDEILTPGARADSLHVLAGGEVEVSNPSYRATFGPGAILGAHAAVGYPEHPHRAVALEDATTLVLPKEDVYDVMEDHFGLARRFFGWLATQNERTRRRRAAEPSQ